MRVSIFAVFEISRFICRNSLTLTHPPAFGVPVGVIPIEFRDDLLRQKIRLAGLLCGVVCIIPRLAVLVEHRLVTVRQTQDHSIYRGSTASRGDN